MANGASNGSHVTVPPGFRFHPTDEELLYYYLRKKVAYESIEMDVIRDIDLNKLEPWDLKDKCRIGSGPQSEWYLFSHKDKKYPTGSRTNRATMAGFWKATGRDKGIHGSNGRRIGMRKTLVFYTGRAPHGNKTDWIMHEYRLIDDVSSSHQTPPLQEDGWVVCRVFKKKHHQNNTYIRPGGEEAAIIDQTDVAAGRNIRIQQQHDGGHSHFKASCCLLAPQMNEVGGMAHKQFYTDRDDEQIMMLQQAGHQTLAMDYRSSMQLPQLMSPEQSALPHTGFMPHYLVNQVDIECSHNLMKLGGSSGSHAYAVGGGGPVQVQDWSILDKLLSSHQISLDHQFYEAKLGINNHATTSSQSQCDQLVSTSHLAPKLPFNYLG